MQVPQFQSWTPIPSSQYGGAYRTDTARYDVGRDTAYRCVYPFASEREFDECLQSFPRSAKSVITVKAVDILSSHAVKRYAFKDQRARVRWNLHVLKAVGDLKRVWGVSDV